jgi:hypothetical protein
MRRRSVVWRLVLAGPIDIHPLRAACPVRIEPPHVVAVGRTELIMIVRLDGIAIGVVRVVSIKVTRFVAVGHAHSVVMLIAGDIAIKPAAVLVVVSTPILAIEPVRRVAIGIPHAIAIKPAAITMVERPGGVTIDRASILIVARPATVNAPVPVMVKSQHCFAPILVAVCIHIVPEVADDAADVLRICVAIGAHLVEHFADPHARFPGRRERIATDGRAITPPRIRCGDRAGARMLARKQFAEANARLCGLEGTPALDSLALRPSGGHQQQAAKCAIDDRATHRYLPPSHPMDCIAM